jgi:IS30 family transposase
MSNLTQYEREKIEFYLNCKCGIREMAGFLNRDHSVISREVQRNKGCFSPYSAKVAQANANRKSHKTNKRKLDKDSELRDHVIEQLREDRSPEQIAGRLAKHPPSFLHGKTISHESIYQYIYDPKNRFEQLYKCLRKGKPKRQERYYRKSQKSTIIERISIHERPEEINLRKTYGHWETDTLNFSKQKTAISVQKERKSQLLRIHKLTNKTAEETKEALKHTIEDIHNPKLFRTLTLDNGTEGAKHTDIRDDYGIITYFCDAYCAWQKGGVENINGLLRQYLPRSIQLNSLTNLDIYNIQEKLNNRPRKCLNYLTPNEVWRQVNQQVVH